MVSDVPVYRPAHDLTASVQSDVDRACAPFLDGDAPRLVVDLGLVGFVSSGGLSLLIHLGRRFDERGGKVVLAGGRRSVVKLIRAVGLDTVLPHFPSVEVAIDTVREERPSET